MPTAQRTSAEQEAGSPPWRAVLLDAALLLLGVILMTMIFGGLAAGVLMLLAQGSQQVMCFGLVHGAICGLALALLVQVLFIGGLAPVVRRVAFLFFIWGLTLVPLCWVAFTETQRPDYDVVLNIFAFPRTHLTACIVLPLMLVELLAWVGLLIYHRYRRRSLQGVAQGA